MYTQLDIRHGGKVYRIEVDRQVGSSYVTKIHPSGIKAICHVSGRADIEKLDPRTGIPLYQGLGSWNPPLSDDPTTDILITIKRGTHVTREVDGTTRTRILDSTISVYAKINYEDLGYDFIRDGITYFVPLDHAQEEKTTKDPQSRTGGRK